MSVSSSDSSTLAEYSTSQSAAEKSTAIAEAHIAQHTVSAIPQDNIERYAEAFKQVRADSPSLYGMGMDYSSRISWEKEFKLLEPKKDSFGVTDIPMEVLGVRDRQTPLLGGFISLEDATVQLEQALYDAERTPRSTHNAVKDLQAMVNDNDANFWGPNLVAKSFHDLDRVLFNGRLKGHCTFQWKADKDYEMADELAVLRNVDMGIRWARVAIQLNADRLLLRPIPLGMKKGEPTVSTFRTMFGVLLHEMTHAYLSILTGSGRDEDEEAEGWDGYHGQHFQRCIHAVDKMSKRLLGLAACHELPSSAGRRIRKPFDMDTHCLKQPHTELFRSYGNPLHAGPRRKTEIRG